MSNIRKVYIHPSGLVTAQPNGDGLVVCHKADRHCTIHCVAFVLGETDNNIQRAYCEYLTDDGTHHDMVIGNVLEASG